jgi:signal transduction histidine kinase
MTTTEERIAAARAVLGGTPVAVVAKGLAVEAELVQRWVDLYTEGGELRLAGRMDPTSFEARDRFLTLIAHEFRTPLTIIGGWVETMLSSDLPADTRAGALDAVARQVRHLERIASDALDAGAVARGQLRLVVAPVELRGLLRSVAASVQDPEVTVEDGPAVDVIGDAHRLEQVVGNLVGHARRLAERNPVRLSLREEHPGRATVDVTIVDRQLPFDAVATLFEPYDREDTSIGTGIGLFLARALIVAHGGEIGVRSDDAATTFWFRLPSGGPDVGPLVERT